MFPIWPEVALLFGIKSTITMHKCTVCKHKCNRYMYMQILNITYKHALGSQMTFSIKCFFFFS